MVSSQVPSGSNCFRNGLIGSPHQTISESQPDDGSFACEVSDWTHRKLRKHIHTNNNNKYNCNQLHIINYDSDYIVFSMYVQ